MTRADALLQFTHWRCVFDGLSCLWSFPLFLCPSVLLHDVYSLWQNILRDVSSPHLKIQLHGCDFKCPTHNIFVERLNHLGFFFVRQWHWGKPFILLLSFSKRVIRTERWWGRLGLILHSTEAQWLASHGLMDICWKCSWVLPITAKMDLFLKWLDERKWIKA